MSAAERTATSASCWVVRRCSASAPAICQPTPGGGTSPASASRTSRVARAVPPRSTTASTTLTGRWLMRTTSTGARISWTVTSWPTGMPRIGVASAVARSSFALPAKRTVIGVRRSVSRNSPDATPPNPPASAFATASTESPYCAIRCRSSATSIVGWVPL